MEEVSVEATSESAAAVVALEARASAAVQATLASVLAAALAAALAVPATLALVLAKALAVALAVQAASALVSVAVLVEDAMESPASMVFTSNRDSDRAKEVKVIPSVRARGSSSRVPGQTPTPDLSFLMSLAWDLSRDRLRASRVDAKL